MRVSCLWQSRSLQSGRSQRRKDSSAPASVSGSICPRPDTADLRTLINRRCSSPGVPCALSARRYSRTRRFKRDVLRQRPHRLPGIRRARHVSVRDRPRFAIASNEPGSFPGSSIQRGLCNGRKDHENPANRGSGHTGRLDDCSGRHEPARRSGEGRRARRGRRPDGGRDRGRGERGQDRCRDGGDTLRH